MRTTSPRAPTGLAGHSDEIRGSAMIVLASVLWSTSGVCIKSLAGYSSLSILGGRSLVCSLVFIALLKGRLIPERSVRRHVLIGAICYALVVASFVIANRYTTAANAILLQYTSVIWIALAGIVFGWDPPGKRDVAAMALGLAGVAVCMGPGVRLFAGSGSASAGLIGDSIAVFSGAAFAGVTLMLRRMNRASRDSNADAAYQILALGSLMSAAIGIVPLISEISTPAIAGQPPYVGWIVLTYLGTGQLAAGYWLWQKGLRYIPALNATLISLIEPLFNPVWVFLVIGERPHKWTFVGAVLILACVALSAMPEQSSPEGSVTPEG